MIHGDLSADLLQTIFMPRTALHDGAVIVRGETVLAAGALLPLAETTIHTERFGTRHRAALGITEQTDAVVVVVSEENSQISLVERARIVRNLYEAQLARAIRSSSGPATAARWSARLPAGPRPRRRRRRRFAGRATGRSRGPAVGARRRVALSRVRTRCAATRRPPRTARRRPREATVVVTRRHRRVAATPAVRTGTTAAGRTRVRRDDSSVQFIVHNWPLKLAAIALPRSCTAAWCSPRTPRSGPRAVPDRPLSQPAAAVLLGNLPPVTSIRYFAPGDVANRLTRDSFSATVDLSGAQPQADDRS